MQFCGANNKYLLPVVVLVLLTSCELAQCQVQAFNCYVDCSFEEASKPNATCPQVATTTECYDVNYDLCLTDESVDEVRDDVFAAKLECEPPTDFQCPSTPPFQLFGAPDLIDLGEADVSPEPHSCAINRPDAMSHCSMFTYSHLRSFRGYRTGLETCTVPGEWYLLKHSAISVIVESEAVPGSNLTQLTKVNVTFSPTPCIGENPLSYVATNESPLPLTLTNGLTPNNSNSALQLKHTTNSSVITLLAVWINTTIIIRQHGNALSVVIQLPGDLSFHSEGLCRGCPRHAYFNVTEKNNEVRSHCYQQNEDAVFRCFFQPELLNRGDFNEILNDTYHDYCEFDLHTTESIDSVALLKAIGHDSGLLQDRGFVPVVIVPTIEIPSYTTASETASETTLPPTTTIASETTLPPITTITTTTTTTRRASIVSMTTTEDEIFSSASTVSQLNFVTLSGLLLCSLARYLIR